ncbi:MAG: trans-2,3-dihydro-3-hydroxyanthranilate isomerase [Solirubrobacteraceae bacterium]|jgi:trans-2,3-dihydro-3-hydroxyanthranilate isomerase|nr:trans-2,3-dihydro-3-hydroxyanthranilate isomerase [Solirubrobacteraceae bacterium]
MRDYVVADVFTDVALQGNPVAVFTDGEGLSPETMQRAARELNLSETVFVLPPEGGADARLRIFTPATELPFAGHPVLGTAFVLGERDGGHEISLLTGSGLVRVRLQRDGERVYHGEMEQPLPTWSEFDRAPELLAALGVGTSELPVEVYDNGPRHAFVALDSIDAVIRLRPNLAALADVGEIGVSCFALAGDGQVRTRMFAPALGVAEDPATGSAAGPLAVHLARHGWTRFGQRIEIRQGEEIGRPSRLEAMADGSASTLERLRVGGGAVIVAAGGYRLD